LSSADKDTLIATVLVCLVHLIRDAEYAIEAGDTAFAPACANRSSKPAASAVAATVSRTRRCKPVATNLTPNRSR
jgi:hypothetical protein